MDGVNYKLVEVRNRFREYYNGALKQKYAELEPARKKYLKKFWFWFVLFTVIAIGYVYFCYAAELSRKECFSEGAIKLYIIYFAIAYAVCAKPVSDFKEETKFAVMDRILDFWGDFQYSSVGGMINKSYIEQSALFAEFNEQEQDDAFRGKYHNTEIKVSEQKLVKVIHTSKGRRDKTIFKGVLIALKLRKQYKGNAVVLGKNDLLTFCRYSGFEMFLGCCALVPIGLLWCFFWHERYFVWRNIFCFSSMIFLFVNVFYFMIFRALFKQLRGRTENRVMLEDVIFSKKWKVYADDQVEARYVLTPALMERMLAVKKLFHGNRLDFSFWDNNLLIAVHTGKDMFETTSLFKSALDYRKVQEVICQLYSVFSVIDALKLQNETKKG